MNQSVYVYTVYILECHMSYGGLGVTHVSSGMTAEQNEARRGAAVGVQSLQSRCMIGKIRMHWVKDIFCL